MTLHRADDGLEFHGAKARRDRKLEGQIMSSILTNNSAMVALQTLKSVNANLQKTQSEISTGKSVASARDNSTVWMILAFEE